MRLILIAAAAAALLAPPASAADKADIEKRYSVIYSDCMEKAGSTAEYVDCIGAEINWQDKYLNRRYQDLMKALTPPQQARLRDAQRAWIVFRDKWCAAQADPAWGSLSTVAANQCVLDQTIERTIALEAYPPAT